MSEPAHPFIRYPNGTTRSCIRCGRPETDECHVDPTEDYAAEHDVIAALIANRPTAPANGGSVPPAQR